MNQKQFFLAIQAIQKQFKYSYQDIINNLTSFEAQKASRKKGAKLTNNFYTTEKRKLAWTKRRVNIDKEKL